MSSRYVNGGVTEVSPGFYEWWERVIVDKTSDDIVYTMEEKYVNRPDLLAYAFYQDSTLWWFICQYNDIINPMDELIAGKILYIPSITKLPSIVNNFIPSQRTI